MSLRRTKSPPSREKRTALLRERLRSAGLRTTLPRIEVLSRLDGASSPLSHADLAQQLVPLGFDRATVYRNLNDLVEADLATRVDVGDHVWRFESRREDTARAREHPHFLCNDCGDVVCLPGLAIPSRGKADARIGDIQDVVLRGRCASC
ncbi:MAG: transcriptional repressor [Deltaproteobacteria bacterium]|nr:transcriptional repressor [Deltaproteobacteria bacterium]